MIPPAADEIDLNAPFDHCRDIIVADWVDANRHMNVAYYMVVFDRGTEAFLQQFGAGRAYTATGAGTVFALEANIRYERELHLHDRIRITTRLVDHDRNKLHLLHSMYHDLSGARAATMELLLLHVDPKTRRGAPWPAVILDRLERVSSAHRVLASPDDARLKVRIRR